MNFLERYKIENDERLIGFNQRQKRILAMMCLERQFKAYQKQARNREWDRSSDYRRLLDGCWSIILDEETADESLWDIHEAIKPENVNKSVDEYKTSEFSYANIFSGNVMGMLENLLDDNGGEEAFRLLNLDYIISYLNEDKENFSVDEHKENVLIVFEKKNQVQDEKDLEEVKTFDDVKKWCERCKSLI